MAVDSMRISQALPTVKCSKCSATISLDDMSLHVCRRMVDDMAPIAESPVQDGRSNYAYRSNYEQEARRPHDKPSYGGSTVPDRRPQWETRRLPGFVEPRNQYPVERPQFPTANASAVLGKIHNIKTGPLDSNGMRRPAPLQRLGPVQTRDPRATMIPIKTHMTDRHGRMNESRNGRPAESKASPRDDNISPTSEQSARSHQSDRSQPKSAGRIMVRDDDIFPSTPLSANDCGPFHHLATKLDPKIFIPADVPQLGGKQQKSKRLERLKKSQRPRDGYDEEWENGGIDDDRPSTANSLGRSIHSSSSNSSLARDRMPQRQQPAQRAQQQEYSRAMPHANNHEHEYSRAQNNHSQPQPHHANAQQTFDDYARPIERRQLERPAPARYEYAKPEPQTRLAAPVASRTHARKETSSSMGTVLTNASMLSARSSISSPPTSEVSSWQSREELARANSHTPTPPGDNDESSVLDATPMPATYTVKPIMTQKTGGAPAPTATGVPRSGTTGSFDRLLEDIGASIEHLDIPQAPFTQASPSSTYSPVMPASQFTSPAQPSEHQPSTRTRHDRDVTAQAITTQKLMQEMKEPVQRLGSPASLQSKTTVDSSSSSVTVTAANIVKDTVKGNSKGSSGVSKPRHRCVSCGDFIVGKSVFSADGALSGRYHKSCFSCTTCRAPFQGGEFYVWRDRAYCARHYHECAGSICHKCGECIEGDCLATQDDKRYHVHCHSARPAQGRHYERF